LYQDDTFLQARSMGDLLYASLQMLEVYPVRKRRVVEMRRIN
jgi:hypothetical protein